MSIHSPESLAASLPWGNTTDPTQHDPANYRYLVHALKPDALMSTLTQAIVDAKNGVTYDNAWGDQSINMYVEPERVAERVSVSMSLIDATHTGTWGDVGLIIEAPDSNIVVTSSSDGVH